ncbi:DUF1553 domain-containing protein [Haloferula sp. BvORR071]|uniref:DUF1553 domain-containing protein n=1 Tax=Haloferula sp. BvORR071 TaxID=1396141 RepID=UPI0006988261|nr:DUF1553 domain-containing protein [Haloferula sp. BvORR071]
MVSGRHPLLTHPSLPTARGIRAALTLAGILIATDCQGATESLPAVIGFNEHIQPILSENCYHCHGPDSGTRKPTEAPLRLDRETEAFAKRENGKPVIVKGDPEASLLIQLIKKPKDAEGVMPPRDSHKELKPQEIALLEEWVRQGAKYEPHWAFAPLKHPEPPKDGEGFAANPIDRFVAQQLAAKGLKPNPPEDLQRFYRRLCLDLTGLPPSAEDTAVFVKRSAEDPRKAVEEAADRLLATPASAEHFTRHWLDAARYADTHGIHIDNFRAIWPYRDWVIRAFQKNMPWDQFTVEQIAGDLLPDATLDQQVATGFNRCLATTGEGGAIPEEYDAIYAKDRTDTTAAVWLGLTTGCASCHDHKFDPLSTKEFYSLTAFFRNTTMSALDGNNGNHPPNVTVPANLDRYTELQGLIAENERKLAEREPLARADFERWLSHPVLPAPRLLDSGLAVHLPLHESGNTIEGTIERATRQWPAPPNRIAGPIDPAPVVSDVPTDLGDLASFSRKDSVSYGGFIRIEGAPTGAVVARMDPAQAFRGWDLYLDNGRPASHVINTWPGNANKLVGNQALTPGVWHHVMITFDGAQPAAKTLTLYVDGIRQESSVSPATVDGDISTGVSLRLGSRNGNDSKLNGKVALQDFRFYRRLLTPAEINMISHDSVLRGLVEVPAGKRTKEQLEQGFQHYLAATDGPARELRQIANNLKAEQAKLKETGNVCLVMEEKKDAKPFAHVLTRGVYSDKGEKVEPNTPAVLPPMAADAPRNRLGLARWLVDPANPLPARVTMNRTWYYFFGTGIVETTEDFGVMGARPTHPQLLDWLAGEFIASKWDYRHMMKLLVTSATYRQSAAANAGKLEKDPLNRLLSRGPRVRLDAEQLRDLALSASGLLVNKVGGPPVRPYQPEGIWEAVAMKQSDTRNYKQDSGESLYRRSLYTLWKRTAAPPSMELFNAPSREVFCVRRERTNTPLQALVMLNDPQFVEAAKMLAARAMESAPGFDSRLDFITGKLIDRSLKPEERSITKATLDEMLEVYRAQTEEAKKLLATGATAAPPTLNTPELAAWTIVASQIMNLDEAVTR